MMLLEAQLEKQAESTLYAQEITEVRFPPYIKEKALLFLFHYLLMFMLSHCHSF